MKTYCLALDLKDDPVLIEAYRRYHEPDVVWPEVVANIKSQGILSEEIFLLGTRMVMVLQTEDAFDFETKAATDRAHAKMQEWEALMSVYQQPLPAARNGEKWVCMESIFKV